MFTIPAPVQVNGEALVQELATAGVKAASVVLVDDELEIDAPASKRATVEQVVAAHSGATLPLPPEQQASEEARAQLAAIRVKAREVAGGNGTFTAAQTQKILAHLILRATR